MLKRFLLLGVLVFLLFPIAPPRTSCDKQKYVLTAHDNSTDVSGRISVNTTWTLAGSPYVVTGELLVNLDVFLTIQPGVIVKFCSGTNLTLDGTLIAKGNATHPIVFTSNATSPAPGDWGSINIRSGGSYKEPSWVTVQYSTRGINGLSHCNSTNCLLYKNSRGLSGADINVTDSNFDRNSVGISCTGLVNIVKCSFTDNDIGVSGGPTNIRNCRFERNGFGVSVLDAVISASTFYNNTNGIGLGEMDSSSSTVRDCEVKENRGTGICVYFSPALIENTNVTFNGGGIYGERGSTTIRNCSISNNNGDAVSKEPGGEASVSVYDSIICNNKGNGVPLRGVMSHCLLSNNTGAAVTMYAGVWEEIHSVIEYSEVSRNLVGIYLGANEHSGSDLTIRHSNVSSNLQGGVLASGYTEGGMSASASDSVFDSNGYYGIRLNSTISHPDNPNPPAPIAFPLTLTNCVISNHTVGAVANLLGVTYSTIRNNSEIGLDAIGISGSICWNNIYGNGLYNLKSHVLYGNDVNATQNWWGTTNEAAIDQKIHDYYDNSSLARVLYRPYLTGPYSPLSFADGFESGSFSNWNGTSVSTGETATVVRTRSHHGNYSAVFTSNGGAGYEKAYCYETIAGSSELYARGYFYVSQSGIIDNDDRFFFLIFRAGTNGLAIAGWRRTSGAVKWCLTLRDGTGYVDVYSSTIPSTGRWYCVELHWRKDSANGLAEMRVDGIVVCSAVGRNTSAFGDCNSVQSGLPQIYSCGPTTVYGDCMQLARVLIGPEQPRIMSLAASPNPFSPNGDGTKDYTTIAAKFSETARYSLQIKNSSDYVVRAWTGTAASLQILWNGKNSVGIKVPDGTYRAVLTGSSLIGIPFVSNATIMITVDTKRPTATGMSVYPASFNPRIGQTTRIGYTLSETCYVTIKIYNSAGTLKRTLLSSALQTSGFHSVIWNGKDSSNINVPRGTYTIKIYVVDKAGNKATPYPTIKTVTVL